MIDKDLFKGKNVAIVGFGLEGKSTLNFLIKHQFTFEKLSVLDVREDLGVNNSAIHLETGNDYLQHLDQFDVIFKSSGVPYSKELLPYKDKIINQMQFFFDHYQGKVIAVSATKGKSTISSLIYSILKNAGYQVALAGNIGTPILDEVDFDETSDFVVCELSSYMLEGLKKKNAISVLGPLFPDHLDWHGGFDNYIQAKLGILDGSEHNIVLQKTIDQYDLIDVYPDIESYGNGGLTSWHNGYFYHNLQELFPTDERLLIGDHNLQNICAAIAVAIKLGVSMEIIQETIRLFKGLPHRLEHVGRYREIEFYDDAISTTPESTIAALQAFNGRVDMLFLGGTDRGYDFGSLVSKIKESGIRKFVFFPPSGERVQELLKDYAAEVLFTSDMQEAVAFAYQHTEPGKICLLSTASPSYSLWKNFEEKGDLFQQWIKKLV